MTGAARAGLGRSLHLSQGGPGCSCPSRLLAADFLPCARRYPTTPKPHHSLVVVRLCTGMWMLLRSRRGGSRAMAVACVAWRSPVHWACSCPGGGRAHAWPCAGMMFRSAICAAWSRTLVKSPVCAVPVYSVGCAPWRSGGSLLEQGAMRNRWRSSQPLAPFGIVDAIE